MKKNFLQKIAIICVLVATTIMFISALCYIHEHWIDLEFTGDSSTMIDNFYKGSSTLGWTSLVFSSSTEAYRFYFNLWETINDANNAFFYTALFGYIFIIVLLIAGNFGRRKYYISNLVCGLLLPIVTIILSIISIVKLSNVISLFNYCQPDLDLYVAKHSYDYAINGQPGIFAIVACIIYICVMVAFGAFTVIKFVKTYPNFKKTEKTTAIDVNNGKEVA